jgi:hypothetical protein
VIAFQNQAMQRTCDKVSRHRFFSRQKVAAGFQPTGTAGRYLDGEM